MNVHCATKYSISLHDPQRNTFTKPLPLVPCTSITNKKQFDLEKTLLPNWTSLVVKSPILSQILVPMQLHCSPIEKEQTFPDLEETSMIVLPLQQAAYTQWDYLHHCWNIESDWGPQNGLSQDWIQVSLGPNTHGQPKRELCRAAGQNECTASSCASIIMLRPK